ncbi:MAG: AraC family transcriptional regulator ligand-binding domain-containing protein [Roseobacter sp.]
MPTNEMVPVFWLRHLVDYLGPDAPHVAATLHAVGLDQAQLAMSDLKIEQHQESEFLSAIARLTNRPFLGAQAGSHLDVRQTTLLSYLLFNSQNVGHALQNLVRFLPLMRPSSNVSVTTVQETVNVLLDNHNPAIAMNPQYIEFCVAMLLNTLQRATKHQIRPLGVSFAHHRSEGSVTLNRLFGCHATFNAETTTVMLRACDLEQPVLHRDPNLYREMLNYGQILIQQTPPAPQTLEDMVADFIAKHMTRMPPSIEETAEALGMSARTLARRLARNGTSYRTVRDNLRLSAAKDMLTKTQTSLAEITYLLGYSDQSAFGAAFKRATDHAPNQYRVLHAEMTHEPPI